MEADLYFAVQEIWHHNTAEEMLWQLHHLHWCQKSKSLNQLVTVFAPKDKHLSSSMLLFNCVSLIVIIDSIGFAQGVSEVMEELGCTIPTSTMEWLKWQDAKHQYDKIYKSKIENQHQCREGILEKIKAAQKNHRKDKENAFKYQPSVAVTGVDAIEKVTKKKRTSQKRAQSNTNNTAMTIEKTKRAKKPPVICPLPGCQKKGHVSARSTYCLCNPNHPLFDLNFVPPPTGKLFAHLHTIKIVQKSTSFSLRQ